jgi:hypothetical protein
VKRVVREVRDRRSEKTKRQRIGGHVRTADRGPRPLHGILRSLSLDNPLAAVELRHQCEEGTVPVRVFVKLLDSGYRTPPEDNGDAAMRRSLIVLKPGETPFDYRPPDTTAATPRTTRIQSFTLGNPVVISRLQGEWEDGTMPPAIRNWFLAHGPELLRKQTERRPPLLIYSPDGTLWDNDPMKEQQDKAIAAQKAQDEIEEGARQQRKQERRGSDAGDQEPEDPNVLEVYRT